MAHDDCVRAECVRGGAELKLAAAYRAHVHLGEFKSRDDWKYTTARVY